jgi:hypothetical protein
MMERLALENEEVDGDAPEDEWKNSTTNKQKSKQICNCCSSWWERPV